MIKKPPKNASMALYEEIVSLNDVESCFRFFQDLCSITELRSMEQRFDVAKLLYQGKVYTEIVEETGASSATISRVNRALKYGENGLLDAFEKSENHE
ncbi:MAG: YerC/YecD family TrpR-related protein [Oscillospiraceae bacterium]|nr:YerC/YecD family TrpR-related protein [Oscillospiraceae bacterium]